MPGRLHTQLLVVSGPVARSASVVHAARCVRVLAHVRARSGASAFAVSARCERGHCCLSRGSAAAWCFFSHLLNFHCHCRSIPGCTPSVMLVVSGPAARAATVTRAARCVRVLAHARARSGASACLQWCVCVRSARVIVAELWLCCCPSPLLTSLAALPLPLPANARPAAHPASCWSFPGRQRAQRQLFMPLGACVCWRTCVPAVVHQRLL